MIKEFNRLTLMLAVIALSCLVIGLVNPMNGSFVFGVFLGSLIMWAISGVIFKVLHERQPKR